MASDADTLTAPDIGSRASWADKYRSQHRETAEWHYVDIELDHPDVGHLSNTEIATILGWEETRVARVRSLYVDADEVAAAIVERIAANEGRSKTPERTPE